VAATIFTTTKLKPDNFPINMAVPTARIEAALKDLNDIMEILKSPTTCVEDSAEPPAQKATQPREYEGQHNYDNAFPRLPPAPRVTFASQLAKLNQIQLPQQQQKSPPELATIHWCCGHTTRIDESRAKGSDPCPAPYHEPFPCHAPECRQSFLKFCRETFTVSMKRVTAPKEDFPLLPGAKEMAPVAEAKGQQATRWAMLRRGR
jgi:hypothetical protein